MAIVIEEQNKKGGLFNILVMILIAGILGAAVYYLFFTEVPLIDKFAPLSIKSLREISSIKITPDKIANDPNISILKQYGSPVSGATAGRSNPFAPVR